MAGSTSRLLWLTVLSLHLPTGYTVLHRNECSIGYQGTLLVYSADTQDMTQPQRTPYNALVNKATMNNTFPVSVNSLTLELRQMSAMNRVCDMVVAGRVYRTPQSVISRERRGTSNEGRRKPLHKNLFPYHTVHCEIPLLTAGTRIWGGGFWHLPKGLKEPACSVPNHSVYTLSN